MTYAEVIERLEREKVLIGELNAHLEQELECISRGDVQVLEETMPHKQKIIKSIAENRNDEIPQADPEPEEVKRVRSLQQDLIKLWRKATGLNNLSRSLVTQRLSEIGYTRDGKKTSMGLHTIKTGV
jgi:hypothetical protein